MAATSSVWGSSDFRTAISRSRAAACGVVAAAVGLELLERLGIALGHLAEQLLDLGIGDLLTAAGLDRADVAEDDRKQVLLLAMASSPGLLESRSHLLLQAHGILPAWLPGR
jgi:hypothetical protein